MGIIARIVPAKLLHPLDHVVRFVSQPTCPSFRSVEMETSQSWYCIGSSKEWAGNIPPTLNDEGAMACNRLMLSPEPPNIIEIEVALVTIGIFDQKSFRFVFRAHHVATDNPC